VADWEKIKAEYITTDISVRDLAQKHGVHYTTIGKKASKEGWQTQRQQQTNTTLTKILQADTEQKVDRATKLYSAADELLNKIVAGISSEGIVSATAAKNYSEALRNIKDIHMIRSAEDIEEQKARIEKLRKESMSDNKKEPIQVILGDGLIEYGK
jgi:hypothetical protein